MTCDAPIAKRTNGRRSSATATFLDSLIHIITLIIIFTLIITFTLTLTLTAAHGQHDNAPVAASHIQRLAATQTQNVPRSRGGGAQ